MAAKSLTGILVVCLLANLCDARVLDHSSRSSDDSSRSSGHSSRSNDVSSRSSDDSSRSSDDSSRFNDVLSRFQGNVPSSTKKCPHLWTEYEDNCFMMYAIPATREDARIECEDVQDGTLVNIMTSRDEDFLVEYWDDISPDTDDIWIGLKRDSDNRDYFHWDNDESMQFEDWIDGEPNDQNGREDCVVFIRGSGWNDRDCYNRKFPFVCMKPRV